MFVIVVVCVDIRLGFKCGAGTTSRSYRAGLSCGGRVWCVVIGSGDWEKAACAGGMECCRHFIVMDDISKAAFFVR